jgi:hypothetical protein
MHAPFETEVGTREDGATRSPDRLAFLEHPRLIGLGLLGANLFGLTGLVALLTGAFAPAQQTVPPPPPAGTPYTAPPSFASSDSNNRMIAVSGVDATGSSILYLVDTEAKQLAVYQANGGGRATQNVRLVGARRIDLDLQLIGFHDDSEYSYEDLEKRFAAREVPAAPAGN